MPHAGAVEHLQDKYGETRQALGLVGNGFMFEVYANLETGTWTVLITSPAMRACIPASGHAYQSLHEVLLEGDPA